MKFKVGDKVKIIKHIRISDNGVREISEYDCDMGKIAEINNNVSCKKYPYDLTGIADLRCEEELELVEESIINKTNMSTISQKIKKLIRTEPNKTFVEVGFMDSNENVTEDGRLALNHILWNANEAKLKALADNILKEDD